MSTQSLPDYDIAIVGGGVSGVYTAWRLLLDGPKHSALLRKWQKERGHLKIILFEGSERIGGRLLSAKAPGLPNILCEIGGMRYVSSQTIVRSLVENKLKLERKEQAVTEPHNLLYLRGKQLRVSDLSEPEKLPYNLAPDEIAWLKKDISPRNTADNFLGYAVEKLFPDIQKHTGPNLREYLNNQVIEEVPLYKHGFWNLVASQLSHEAYLLAVTTVGYDCLGYNTNAVDAICEYYDFTPDVKYYLLKDGYDAVVWNLQKEFEDAGGEIKLETWLSSVDEETLSDNCKGVALRFRNNERLQTARAVVLAMPKRSLELLEQKGPLLDPDKKTGERVRYMMNAVIPIPLYKMFIAYDQPWWEKEAVTEGRSLTDLPIRQCYYWGVENGKDNGSAQNHNAILMVYNDAISSDFWAGLRSMPKGADDYNSDTSLKFQRKEMPDATNGVKEDWHKRLEQNWHRCEAPKAMVNEMHRELQIMHNVTDAPEPLEAAYMDWGDDPYGGAVHFWNSGYKSSEVLQDMIQPVKSFPCYVCGEAFSTNQTWVEGALQTAELVLRKFDIPEPEWITNK
jgi:hypothetical protein